MAPRCEEFKQRTTSLLCGGSIQSPSTNSLLAQDSSETPSASAAFEVYQDAWICSCRNRLTMKRAKAEFVALLH